MNPWEHTLASWNLAEAGRWEEAMLLAGSDPELAQLLLYRHRPEECSPSGVPALEAWRAYRAGSYRTALGGFLTALEDTATCGWLRAWSMLGVAKVASDSGRWRAALEWCASAWLAAAEAEHTDLLAHIAGARGEILLRAGHPAAAAAAFSEDLALLPPGSRYRGRLRCCQAHSWARMGPSGQKAALLTYRLAGHSPAESGTAGFAAAGLALLAVRRGTPEWIEETSVLPCGGISRFWLQIARAAMEHNPGRRRRWLEESASILPEIHCAERWWFSHWSAAIGGIAPSAPDPAEHFPHEYPCAPGGPFTGVELPLPLDEIQDAPWWSGDVARSAEEWWTLRDCFMP